MVKREVKFFVRIFPTLEKDLENFKIESNRKIMHIRAPDDIGRYEPKFLYWEFVTDGIFCSSCQIDVYQEAVEDLIFRALNGEDFLVLAYGPSSTGKTYTMFGLNGKYEDRGIGPRMLTQLFKFTEELHNHAIIQIYLSFLEFYGNEVRNLLKKEPNILLFKKDKEPRVKCNTESEVLRLIFDGESRRKFEKGHISCSTTALTFYLDVIWLTKPYSHVQTKIHLVDTSGTESISSKVRSDPCQIVSNMTMCWIDYVLANSKFIRHDEEREILARASPLTEHIGNVLLRGNVRLIGHVSLNKGDLLPTLSAMKFGAELKKLPLPELVYAKKLSQIHVVQSLQEENHRLKDEILLKELLQGEYKQSNVSQEELGHISRLAEEYLQGRVLSPSVLATTEMSIVLPILRDVYTKEVTELKKKLQRVTDDTTEHVQTIVSPVLQASKMLKRYKKASLTRFRSVKRIASMSRTAKSRVSMMGRKRSVSGLRSSSKMFKKSIKSVSLPSSASVSIIEPDDEIKNQLWQEFYTRYPSLDTKLRTLKTKVLKSLGRKEEAAKNAMILRCRLDAAKLKLEDAQWRRKATLGEIIGPDGQELKSDAEIEAMIEVESIHTEMMRARQDAAATHSKYMENSTYYNDIFETVRLEFLDYVNKTYTNVLILPETEQPERHSEATLQTVNVGTHEEEPDPEIVFFQHLQASHGRNLTGGNAVDCIKIA